MRRRTRRRKRYDPRMLETIELLTDGTVMVNGDTRQQPMMQIAERGADLRPVWKELQKDVLDPKIYTRPDRIEGGVGPIPNDPGYLQKGKNWKGRGANSPHIAARRTKRRFRIVTTRPFLPTVTDEWRDKAIAKVKNFIVSGVIE